VSDQARRRHCGCQPPGIINSTLKEQIMKPQFQSHARSQSAMREITSEECDGVGGGFLPLIIGAAILLGACTGANSNKAYKQSTLPTQPK
jgi:hypothetical protein